MCGRYALNLSPAQVRRMLVEQDMPVAEAPEPRGNGAPRQTYNFAPGYYGVVYRAQTSDRGAVEEGHDDNSGKNEGLCKTGDQGKSVSYKLQSMKWGLIPFWTKRNPDYGTMMKTINCRDDSLSAPGGMWATMKARKRCVVIAQGFFEWLKTGPKNKQPHYIKRRDDQLMCFAGLWDCAQFEDCEDKTYTYTIITTDSNKQMKFLHDRMPVILEPGSDALRTWLDPGRGEWSHDLQSLLKPFTGELDIYPVTQEVGKVGNNSPSFIIPVDSKDNKSNIANFFANASKKSPEENSPRKISSVESKLGTSMTPLKRKAKEPISPSKKPDLGTNKKRISSTHNSAKGSSTINGSQKITKFFGSN